MLPLYQIRRYVAASHLTYSIKAEDLMVVCSEVVALAAGSAFLTRRGSFLSRRLGVIFQIRIYVRQLYLF